MGKRAFSLITAASLTLVSLTLTGCGGGAKSEYDDGKMRDDMSAMEYARDMGVGINLGNTIGLVKKCAVTFYPKSQ